MIEGNFTGWTAVWGWGLSYYSDTPAFFMDEVNDVFYMWQNTGGWPSHNIFGSYNIADHSTIFESPNSSTRYLCNEPRVWGAGDHTFWQGCRRLEDMPLRSHLTYILLNRTDYYTIEVWRTGSLLWSRDIRDDTGEAFGEIYGAEFSQTAKYIMLFDIVSWKLWLYEGAS